MTSRILTIWLAGSVLGALFLAPFLARGSQQKQTVKQNAIREIEHLSETQLARLKQNNAAYQTSSREEQAAYNTLHAAIEKDQREGNGELTQVMHNYDAWLKTIEPYQREQLSQIRDPQERIALMEKIVDLQREKSARRSIPFGGPHGDRGPQDRFLVLSGPELDRVMQALEEAARPRLSESQRSELDQLQGLAREVRLLQFLRDFGTGVNSRPFFDEPPLEFDIVAHDIDQYVENSRIRDFIHGPGSNGPHPGREDQGFRPPPGPDVQLARLLAKSLLVKLFRDRQRAVQEPNPEELVAFLDTLPADRQYELLSEEASDFQFHLRNEYLDSKGIQNGPGMRELMELFGRRDRKRGEPGERPFSGGDRNDRGRPGGPNRDGRPFRDRLPGGLQPNEGRPPRAEGDRPPQNLPSRPSPENN